MAAGVGCDVSGFAVWMDAAMASCVSPYWSCRAAHKHSLLLLPPLLPESSLGMLMALARCMLSICEDMAMQLHNLGSAQTQRQL